MEYLTDTLYNGFYGFEAMTKRDLNSVICGKCGVVGKTYFGDGNEKNCCNLREVSKKDLKLVLKSKLKHKCTKRSEYAPTIERKQ